MFSRDVFHAMTDEREREIRELVRVRNLLRGGRHGRIFVLPPRKPPMERGR